MCGSRYDCYIYFWGSMFPSASNISMELLLLLLIIITIINSVEILVL